MSKKKRTRPNSALKLTLEEAGFSGWPLHCLVVLLGVRTLKELVQYSWQDILESTSGFTETWPKGWHYLEITRKLNEYGLKLKGPRSQKAKLDPKIAEHYSVASISLGQGILQKLKARGIGTVGDLMHSTAIELLDIPYVGVSSVYKIVKALELQGLQLAG